MELSASLLPLHTILLPHFQLQSVSEHCGQVETYAAFCIALT